MRIEFPNLKDILKKMGSLPQHLEDGIKAELRRQAELVMTESKDVYCPVKTGELRRSGQVWPAEVSRKVVSVTLGYGNAAVAYARRVHEARDNWNWTKPGTGPKYLERPLKKAQPAIGSAIKKVLDEKLKV